ncbi:GC-rich sequence DNA-binding factor-like protein [Mycena indigotica]|uniref:GC-rich sequence DNA-binding factor-like protein n=1 Tax=Mycena indigotica TaxID=2126181 RepID=A0A8H6SG54_9AGAR|nr:GC-rich sequence DNA-binding factor-like protein [Mycena indigotica]KAF7298985.1 GC-rich sequence DNA-binding factor-like protein [Mycena indigotica]
MSDQPLLFKRRSKPAARVRASSPETETTINDNDTTANESPSTLATRLKTKAKRASRPKARLSFGGDSDEEGSSSDVFKVKKSNLSQRLTLGTHPALAKSGEASSNRGPTYDQAYLNELKANTPSSRPEPVIPTDGYDADMSMDVDMSADISMQDDPAVYIHSESSIKQAKERRGLLRKTGVPSQDDFISLSVVKRSDEDQGPHPESRLVREEDELGEGDDEFAEYTSAQERIALGKKSRKLEASKRRDEMKELIADAEEVDEETEEWEQEQIRRAGHASFGPPAKKAQEIYKPTPIPPATPLPTLAPAVARLAQQLAQLTASHASNTATLTSLAQERLEVDEREKEMRQMVEKAEIKRAWFGEFREWVEGVAAFLDEKYPRLEKLEDEHISLLKERHDMIKQRRQADDEDDLCTFLGITQPPAEEETDDLGRVIPKPTPASRRAARLARHRRHHPNEDEEGYSTDASLAADDKQSYSNAITSLTERTGKILSDVRAEEFHDPGKGRWSDWREQYAESYVGAWGGLGVVSVWEFWVRLEMIGWDIIKDPRSLDSFEWYNRLYAYSRPNGEDLGPDGDLVASMISTAVIPRICKLLEGGSLDVYSDAEIRRVVDLVEELEASVEPGNAKFLVLLQTVYKSFQTAISEVDELVSTSKARSAGVGAAPFDPASIPARTRYLNRRIKLLRNLVRWRKYSGAKRFGIEETVQKLANTIRELAEGAWDGGQSYMEQVRSIVV